jgi:hypothetical protein
MTIVRTGTATVASGGGRTRKGLPHRAAFAIPLRSLRVLLFPCADSTTPPLHHSITPPLPCRAKAKRRRNHSKTVSIHYQFTVLYAPRPETRSFSGPFEPFRGKSSQAPFHEQLARQNELFQSRPIVSNQGKSRCFSLTKVPANPSLRYLSDPLMFAHFARQTHPRLCPPFLKCRSFSLTAHRPPLT